MNCVENILTPITSRRNLPSISLAHHALVGAASWTIEQIVHRVGKSLRFACFESRRIVLAPALMRHIKQVHAIVPKSIAAAPHAERRVQIVRCRRYAGAYWIDRHAICDAFAWNCLPLWTEEQLAATEYVVIVVAALEAREEVWLVRRWGYALSIRDVTLPCCTSPLWTRRRRLHLPRLCEFSSERFHAGFIPELERSHAHQLAFVPRLCLSAIRLFVDS
mmetsp:Transcript_4096/g.10237  ORF Transcript_4096/g.10237 Transcript_4096/m.10237 type:complete len:220 (+) Transcript_4096:203-862(+)